MFAITDIETTGGNAYTDRITEIAILIHNGTEVIDRYSTLINPGRPIPPFVQNLTGITDEMVAGAPAFSEVAHDIRNFIEPYIFVAHSAAFDYAFIRQEFKQVGHSFSRPWLCTVSLSRKVMPGHTSYGLGKICQRLNIVNEGRHRASGDALATARLFERLMEHGAGSYIDELVKPPEKEQELPSCLTHEMLYALPNAPGVFYMYDAQKNVVFIGSGSSIRKGVIQIVSKARSTKITKLKGILNSIDFIETGNALLALMIELSERNKLRPELNKFGHKTNLRSNGGFNGYLVLRGRSGDEEVFIRMNSGAVTGYAYFDKLSQGIPDEMLTPYVAGSRVNHAAMRIMRKNAFVRLQPD